jgi:hypothetical protein
MHALKTKEENNWNTMCSQKQSFRKSAYRTKSNFFRQTTILWTVYFPILNCPIQFNVFRIHKMFIVSYTDTDRIVRLEVDQYSQDARLYIDCWTNT